jgi:pyruvate/2-oxoglutarate/acetoin dehydrogenase E1 component
MLHVAIEAAAALAAEDVSVEIVDLRSILPWDSDAVLNSVRKTSRLLVLHEDTYTAGFGAEILATVAAESFEYLDAPPQRLTAPDCPVPFAPSLERRFLPQVEDVLHALRELLAY